MFNRNVPYMIFAIDADGAPAEFDYWCKMRDLRVIKLVGSYKGEAELSYAVESELFWQNQIDFWWCEKQESILEVSSGLGRRNPQRMAYLQYARGGERATRHNRLRIGEREKLGIWTEVSPAEAHAQDAWTLNPKTGQYFLAKQED